MSDFVIGPGTCLGFGATNARKGLVHQGEVRGFVVDSTPEQPKEFFRWMARHVLEAAGTGSEWVVAGFPGPVTPDGAEVGPMVNVPGLADKKYHLLDELTGADEAVGRLQEQGFHLIAVNDGELAAQAAAERIAVFGYDVVAALIIGTGIGAGIVKRDAEHPQIFRADHSDPIEIGHIDLLGSPLETLENRFSGTAIEKRFGNPEKLPASHPVWEEEGRAIGSMAMLLGLMNGAKLVVPCGGVGAGASRKYARYLWRQLEHYAKHGNGAQKQFLPEVSPVPRGAAQVFELHGGAGVMRDFLTRDSLTSQ